MEQIRHIKINGNQNIHELIKEFSGAGINAGKLAQAVEVFKEIKQEREKEKCKLFFGVAGALVPAGLKNVILGFLSYSDVFVTTGANLTHDLIEALGYVHYKGFEGADDKKLYRKGIDRIYNIFMKNKVYAGLEDFFKKNWSLFAGKKISIKEFLWLIGSLLEDSVNKENSILYMCYKNKIPIFCPAISDSGIGLMVWNMSVQNKGEIFVDAFSDLKEIIDIAWTSKKNAVLYVGGGVPKNYIQQAMQFSKGADYGIQVTTDTQYAGGSSGAPLKEGISWGKMKSNANFVDVHCDASIALPLILAGVI